MPAEPLTAPDPRYPTGRFDWTRRDRMPDAPELAEAISIIAALPEQLRNALSGLDHVQLDTPYRDGGWTVRQTAHHIADSHINAFVRIRLALTEPNPTVTLYNEATWADLHDDLTAPPAWSVDLLEGLHARWVMMLQSLTPEQFARTFIHPKEGSMSVALATLVYAWHSRHHVAHITHLRAARGW